MGWARREDLDAPVSAPVLTGLNREKVLSFGDTTFPIARLDRATQYASASRFIVNFSHAEQPPAAQEREQLQQGQAEDGEKIALDMVEQMNPQPFQLVGTDA